MWTGLSHVKEALHDARQMSKIVFQFLHCVIKFGCKNIIIFRNINKHDDKCCFMSWGNLGYF